MGVVSKWEPIKGETPIDPEGLKDRSITTRTQLNRAEAKNILRPTIKYLSGQPSNRTAPFDYNWALQLHKEMFGDVWEWAGVPRTRDLTIGVQWELIGQELGGLFLNIVYWKPVKELLLEQVVTIHHTAVKIHPFYNGNGRWSRMLANIWLRKHGSPIIEWPEAEVGTPESTIRNEYIAAIVAADQNDFAPLFELHRRFGVGM